MRGFGVVARRGGGADGGGEDKAEEAGEGGRSVGGMVMGERIGVDRDRAVISKWS